MRCTVIRVFLKIVDNKIFESVTVSTNISNHALKRIEKHENMHKNNL